MEFLLGDQFHVETVKRSAGIMKFLANQNALTYEHLDLLWKSTFNAHEASIRAIYDVIIELSAEISVEVDCFKPYFTSLEFGLFIFEDQRNSY